MGWRRSFRQSGNLPITVAGFALLRRAAASFYAAESLSRRVRQVLGVLLFLVISVTSTITFAQEPSPVQKAAEIYQPKLVKKFPPNRTSPCAGCKGKQEDLNAAWQELFRFDKEHADVRAVRQAWMAESAAEEKLAQAKKAGTGVKEAQAALTTAKANSKAAVDTYKPYTKQFSDEDDKLNQILDKIKDAAKALEDCEKKCPKDAPVAGGGGTDTGGGTGTGGETVTPKITLPKIPDDCWTEDEKTAFLNKWSKVLKEQQQEAKKYKDLISFYDEKIKEGKTLTASEVSDQKDAATKAKQYQENVDALNVILEKADAKPAKKKKEDCNPKDNIYKSSKFIFPGHGSYSRPGGNTYNVTFSGDSTQQCTFADGAGVPAPINFADANGNPTETYFDPKTGESSDFGPDETPPPGWKKVIPTSDPKPKPGMWNLGNQPELWVDPETGQTKWVEVGSDYKPVDPPQGWVELVPRSEPSSRTAEAPPTRTTETPPRTPTTETPPRTPTTETPPRTPTTETPPRTPTTETPPRTPTTETPPRTPTTETPPPRTPDTPPTRTTDVPPRTPTSDDIPTTVFVKANEEVVQGGPTGQPLASQMVKLLAERPALPSSRESKTTQDTGFDKPPAQCTTGADGRCNFQIPADERPIYGLPVTDTAARRPNYRVEFNALKSSGGVAEITGRKPPAEKAPAGGNIASDVFSIGNRIFQRFGFNTPYESREDVEASYRAAFGDRYQVDTCETKKLPGPPLGIEPSSFNEPNHELSQATIKLGRTARSGRASR
jgi:hypothetical protein